jgi:hypothetical protein
VLVRFLAKMAFVLEKSSALNQMDALFLIITAKNWDLVRQVTKNVIKDRVHSGELEISVRVVKVVESLRVNAKLSVSTRNR